MDIQLLLDADNFWPALEADIAGARDSVYIQTLSFEADTAGRKLTAAMAACSAGDRRIIVDEFYARHRVNDHYLRHPRNWFRRASWRERDDTLRMYDELARLGAQVKLVNPVGFMHLHCHLRNHKKIITIDDNISLDIDLPVMRPILFGVSFDMLQFEPSVTLKFRKVMDGKVDFVGGPSLGISFHYGPDYNSEEEGSGRTTSFFAMGPTFGGYVGLDFKRPGEVFNFQLGLSPYVTPLFSIDDPEDHRGVVVGGLLDGIFRFRS